MKSEVFLLWVKGELSVDLWLSVDIFFLNVSVHIEKNNNFTLLLFLHLCIYNNISKEKNVRKQKIPEEEDGLANDKEPVEEMVMVHR